MTVPFSMQWVNGTTMPVPIPGTGGFGGSGPGVINPPSNPTNPVTNPTVNPTSGGGMNEQSLLDQLIAAINDPNTQAGGMMENAPTGQAGLNPFFNTPMYQLMYGENANQVDPTQRFRADPGYQFAQDQAFNQLQRSGAAKGLLESGRLQLELQNQSQGMADQNYQRWLGQQHDLYSSYQQQLAGLANMGMQNNGANAELQAAMMLGPLLGGYNMQTGQNMGGANMWMGENLGSLYSNQGSWLGNAYINQGAALANMAQNQWGMGQQIANNNAAGFAGTWNSGNQGSAAMNAASGPWGGRF